MGDDSVLEVELIEFLDEHGGIKDPESMKSFSKIIADVKQVDKREFCLIVLDKTSHRDDCNEAFVSVGGLKTLKKWLSDAKKRNTDVQHLIGILKCVSRLPLTFAAAQQAKLGGTVRGLSGQSKHPHSDAEVAALADAIVKNLQDLATQESRARALPGGAASAASAGSGKRKPPPRQLASGKRARDGPSSAGESVGAGTGSQAGAGAGAGAAAAPLPVIRSLTGVAAGGSRVGAGLFAAPSSPKAVSGSGPEVGRPGQVPGVGDVDKYGMVDGGRLVNPEKGLVGGKKRQKKPNRIRFPDTNDLLRQIKPFKSADPPSLVGQAEYSVSLAELASGAVSHDAFVYQRKEEQLEAGNVRAALKAQAAEQDEDDDVTALVPRHAWLPGGSTSLLSVKLNPRSAKVPAAEVASADRAEQEARNADTLRCGLENRPANPTVALMPFTLPAPENPVVVPTPALFDYLMNRSSRRDGGYLSRGLSTTPAGLGGHAAPPSLPRGGGVTSPAGHYGASGGGGGAGGGAVGYGAGGGGGGRGGYHAHHGGGGGGGGAGPRALPGLGFGAPPPVPAYAPPPQSAPAYHAGAAPRAVAPPPSYQRSGAPPPAHSGYGGAPPPQPQYAGAPASHGYGYSR